MPVILYRWLSYRPLAVLPVLVLAGLICSPCLGADQPVEDYGRLGWLPVKTATHPTSPPTAAALKPQPVSVAIPEHAPARDLSLVKPADYSLTGQELPGTNSQLLVSAGPPLPGAILPKKRIVAFYGNPLSPRMGILGQCDKEELLRRLRQEVKTWEAADPTTEVQPALHLIAVVAQGTPGRAGKYRKLMTDALVEEVYSWAKEAGALLFIDIQTGHEDIRTLLPRFEWILKNPDVHLGMDPEFNLVNSQAIPGTRIGSFDAVDVNAVSAWLADLVRRYHLPPKVLTVHRFTRDGVTHARNIVLRPEVQIVMHMDGWGPPAFKRATYRDCVAAEPVQYTGFKLFFHNDTKEGDPLMTPQQVLSLRPKPLYIQYQ
jgi:hypothetical protein